MEKEQRVFYLNDREAEAVAKAEVGSGDLPEKLSSAMAVLLIAVLILRIALHMPIPQFRVLGAYLVALTAWVLTVLYINRRVKRTAEELNGRSFYLDMSENGIAVGKYRDETFFHAGWDEIRMVETGSLIYRFTAPIGRVCVPRQLFTAQEKEKIESLNVKSVRRSWM